LTDDLIRLPTGRRLDIRLAAGGAKLSGSVSRGTSPSPPEIAVLGRVARGGPLEELLGTRDRSDAELIGATFERFGWGGFLRISGSFVAAIAGEELVLVRSASFGAEPALYFRETQDGLQFSTDLSDLRGEPDVEALRGWLVHRLWADRSATWRSSVSQLSPGSVLIESRAGRKVERFWTFSPFGVPRLLPEAEAQRELERAMPGDPEREVELVAERPLSELLLARFPRALAMDRRWDFDPPSIARAYRAIAWPVALSEAAEIAALMRSDRPLVTDLGMREVLGATETGMAAYVESISAAIGASPSPSTLVGVLREAGPIDRRLSRSRLLPSLVEHARIVGNRWKRHLPPLIAERVSIAEPARSVVEPVTGDRFVDRRFAETLDPGLGARHRAIASVRQVIAPFLDPAVIELLFSLPKPHFVHEGRMMRIVRGGVPLSPFSGVKIPRYPDDHPHRSLPRRWFYDLERDTDEDRWLGLGAFLSAWEG
jgi:hypothetical protein